ncbi:MAG: type II secretion system F family protein [Patescibacteria group bacterium]
MNNPFLSIPLEEKILFSRHLSMAIKAGMPILDALKFLKGQIKSKILLKILDEAIIEVGNGQFLSQSMENYRYLFGDLFLNIIKIGETSGTLAENLLYLAQELKKKQEFKSKVRSALIYPAVILTATLGLILLLIIFVFPKILPIFQSLNMKLPLTTRILIGTVNFVSQYWLIIIGGFLIISVVVWLLMKMKKVRFFIQWFFLKIPFFGKLNRNINLFNFTRNVGLLLKSGVKIVDTLSITSNSFTNLVYQEELRMMSETVKKGEQISRYLKAHQNLFPFMMANMIEIGENTGNLIDNLFYLSEYYEAEVDETVKNLGVIIEPILLIFIGVMVGFIALSVITPIYQSSQGF